MGDKGLPDEEVENLDELINDPKALLAVSGFFWIMRFDCRHRPIWCVSRAAFGLNALLLFI